MKKNDLRHQRLLKKKSIESSLEKSHLKYFQKLKKKFFGLPGVLKLIYSLISLASFIVILSGFAFLVERNSSTKDQAKAQLAYVCPQGATLVNDTCVAPLKTCPTGYSGPNANGVCVSPGGFTCPSGGTLQGNLCVATPTTPLATPIPCPFAGGTPYSVLTSATQLRASGFYGPPGGVTDMNFGNGTAGAQEGCGTTQNPAGPGLICLDGNIGIGGICRLQDSPVQNPDTLPYGRIIGTTAAYNSQAGDGGDVYFTLWMEPGVAYFNYTIPAVTGQDQVVSGVCPEGWADGGGVNCVTAATATDIPTIISGVNVGICQPNGQVVVIGNTYNCDFPLVGDNTNNYTMPEGGLNCYTSSAVGTVSAVIVNNGSPQALLRCTGIPTSNGSPGNQKVEISGIGERGEVTLVSVQNNCPNGTVNFPDCNQCPAGQELISGVCLPLCPVGQFRNAQGVCEAGQQQGCPTGQVLDSSGQCVTVINYNNLENCDAGTQTIPNTYTCDFNLIGSLNNRYQLPSGGIQSSTSTEGGNNTSPVSGGYSPDCVIVNNGSPNALLRCITIPTQGGTPGNRNVLIRIDTQLPQDKGNVTLVTQTSDNCPVGQELVNGQCQSVCPQGQIRNSQGNCQTIITANNIGQCSPNGQTVVISNTYNCEFQLSGSPNNQYVLPQNGINASTSSALGQSPDCLISGNGTVNAVLTCNQIPTTNGQPGQREVLLTINQNLPVDKGDVNLILANQSSSQATSSVTSTSGNLLDIICNEGNPVLINSVTVCVVNTNNPLPNDFKIGIGNAIPGGSCVIQNSRVSILNIIKGIKVLAQQSNLTYICTNVPTGSLEGLQPINYRVGNGVIIDSGRRIRVIAPISTTVRSGGFAYTVLGGVIVGALIVYIWYGNIRKKTLKTK